MVRTALVVGASGIIGGAISELLLKRGWNVMGLARRPKDHPQVHPVVADLQNADETAEVLQKNLSRRGG